jgi:hypothetical protein
MKIIARKSLLTMCILLAYALILNLQAAGGSKNPGTNNPGTALPDSIHKIVQKACMDCHADDGNFMAKGKVNFSAWDQYDADKQASKANAMCKELSKSAMPPKKWRANNAKDVPTQAEVDMICKWAKSLQK